MAARERERRDRERDAAQAATTATRAAAVEEWRNRSREAEPDAGGRETVDLSEADGLAHCIAIARKAVSKIGAGRKRRLRLAFDRYFGPRSAILTDERGEMLWVLIRARAPTTCDVSKAPINPGDACWRAHSQGSVYASIRVSEAIWPALTQRQWCSVPQRAVTASP
jgi:hypothetical protein